MYTNWNGQPYPGSAQGYTGEFVPSARQSRLSFLVSGKPPIATLNGFFEGDYLSAGTTSNNLQSNSYTLRVRQAWAQEATKKNIFTGGQMWTLLTEHKAGATPGQEALPLFFDGNLHVGFTYARQPGFRSPTVGSGYAPAPVLALTQRGTSCRDQSAGCIAFTVAHPAAFSTAWPTPTLSEIAGQVWGVRPKGRTTTCIRASVTAFLKAGRGTEETP